MLHFHDEISIAAPVEHVWALFSDTSRWEEWMPATFSDFSGPPNEAGNRRLRENRRMREARTRGPSTMAAWVAPSH